MYTRRELGKLALTAVPAISVVGASRAFASTLGQSARPNSKVAGVQIGLNVPYSFGSRTMSGDETLKRCLELGISGVELRSQPVEIALGSPGFGRDGTTLPARGATPTERQALVEAVRKWRASVRMDAVQAFRKSWDDAGVIIEIVKIDGIYDMTDEELDYTFRMAKALGARALSTEIALGDLGRTQRVGQFADRHQVWVGYHGHAETTPADWETTFGYAKYNAANLDIGHFVAGHNTSPVPFLKQHHDRITHIHVKDRKAGLNGGANTEFGKGDTPIVEVLRLIRDNKWPIQATIEFEYPVPAGSDRMTEIKKCVDFCRAALTS